MNEADIDAIFELMRKNTLFYEYHPPFVTKESIAADMNALPPQKGYEDKCYVGFFEGKTLVAIMDLILAYPADDIAWIGLFMIDIQAQNRGIGSSIINDVCAYLKELGYQKIRLGVDKGNPQSYAFWLKNRFRVLNEKAYRIMELAL